MEAELRELLRGHSADVANRVTLDLDTGSIDEDDAGDAVGCGSESEFGGEPSAHRGADDEDVREVVLDEVLARRQSASERTLVMLSSRGVPLKPGCVGAMTWVVSARCWARRAVVKGPPPP